MRGTGTKCLARAGTTDPSGAREPFWRIDALKDAYEGHGGEFDVNNGKDAYGRLSYKIGGLGVFGGGQTTRAKNWRDDSLKLGAFFYRGAAGAFVDRAGAETFVRSGTTFWRYGFDIDGFIKDVNILGGTEEEIAAAYLYLTEYPPRP